MSHRTRLVVALASTLVIGYVFAGSLLGRVLGDTSYGQLSIFNEVVRMVLESYVEPVNLDRAMAGARLGLTEALDGDSAYLDAEEYRLLQQGAKEGEAEVGLALTRRFGYLMAVAARPGSPAERAGIRPGDVLRSIDGRHTRPLAVPTGERLLRGAPGSNVKLVLLRAGSEPLELTLTRERIVVTPPQGKLLEDGAGYLKLTDFAREAAEEVRGEVEALKRSGARRLVLDLRGAAFGSPAEGVKVAELFVRGGVLAKLTSSRAGEQLFQGDPARALWEGPLAVLVDNGTAGAGEIVAGAVLDAGRGEIVGEPTFGRAAVQKTVPLPEGALLLTTGKYTTPKGTDIHGRGLSPSIAVARSRDESEAEAGNKDPILDKALELLREDASAKKAARLDPAAARGARGVSEIRPA
jgi:carboxyl-terminal processing protease